jgi:hypothetical protein
MCVCVCWADGVSILAPATDLQDQSEIYIISKG